jgi:hypothetical protein
VTPFRRDEYSAVRLIHINAALLSAGYKDRMRDLANIVPIAEEMIRQFGEQSYAATAMRAINNYRCGDREAGAMWLSVAEAVKAIQSPRTTIH